MRTPLIPAAAAAVACAARGLPDGNLPEAEWRRRHSWIVKLLWAHLAVFTAWGFSRGDGFPHGIGHVLPLLAFVVAAASDSLPRRVRAAASSVGAFSASATVVHLSGGATEAHFHFFVLVVVLALYEDWLPFLLGVGFVLLHHAAMGLVAPEAVFVREDQFARPLTWSLVHAIYVFAAGAAAVLAWRFNKRLRADLGEAQERFRHAFGQAPIGMALVRADGGILQVNSALARLLGFSEAELLARDFHDLHHPDDLEDAVRLKDRLVAGEIDSYSQKKRYLHRSGAPIWVSVSASLVRDREGRPLYLIGQVEDVTEQHRAEERLRRQQSDLLAISEVIRHIATERDARPSVCDAARRLTGAGMAALIEPDGDLLRVTASSGVDLTGVEIELGREASGAAVAFVTRRPFFAADARHALELSPRLVAAAGAESLLFHPVQRDDACVGVLVVGWSRQITGLESREADLVGVLAGEAALALEHLALLERIEQIARTDPLTGLPNRRVWDEKLPQEIARAQRTGAPLCVALMDVDDFKAINDSGGHAAGDAFLAAAAQAWSDRVRVTDLVVRLGGDEFGLLLPACRLEEAMLLAQRLAVAVPGGRTCSVGVAELKAGDDAAAVVQRADAALYRAKALGRGRVLSMPVATA